MRSGGISVNVDADNATSRNIGRYGYARSRMAADFSSTTDDNISKTNTLLFDTTNIRSITNQQERRYYGFPIRCLSTAVEGEESGRDEMCSLAPKYYKRVNSITALIDKIDKVCYNGM